MGIINPQVPVVGQPNATEEPKITSAINTIATEINGNLDNANIKTGAAVAHNKLANTTAGRVLLGNASNVPTATALSGDVTVNSSGVTTIANAAVTAAKLAGEIPSGKLKWAFYGNAGTVKNATGILANVEVFPGVFLAIATVSTNGNCHTFGLGGSGGVSSVAYPEPPFTNLERLSGQAGDKYSSATFAALVTVTAATDLQLSAAWVDGNMFGNLTVFGVSA